jgi:4-amino-4-deoxy-L-arabinose transferase-like glycosyltransferase
MNSQKYLLIGLIILSSLLFFHKLGSYTLFDVDEAVFSEAAREMIETGDWITPKYNYINRYDKPALFYWLMASSYSVFGVNEFAARFWSALMGVFLIAATFLFTKRIDEKIYGLLSGFILATSVEIIGLAHSAITDMTLTFFIAASLYLFFLSMEGRDKRLYLISYALMAIAVLTKGPIGIAIPAMTIIPYLILTKRFKETIKEAKLFSGAIIFLAIVLPWYILEIRANGWEYINAFFLKHNIQRFTSVNSGHSGPIFYYIPVILIGFFPWSAFLPYAIYKLTPRDLKELNLNSRLMLFSVIWFSAVFLFFSLSRTKLPNYIASLFPPMAMITAMLLKEFLVGNKEESKGTKYSAAFFSILCLILAVGFILIPAILNKIHSGLPDGFADIPIKIGKWPIILAMLFFASGILSAIAFLKDMRSLLIGLIGLTSSIFLLIAFNLAMPDIERLIQSPLKNFATAIREKNEPERRIASYRINNPSILFYSQQRVLTLHKDNIEELKAMAGEGTPLYVITKLPYARELKEATGMHYAGQDSIYVLLANNMAQCMLDKK